MDRYIIRRATYDDIDLIRQYIADNWRRGKDHIMARDRAFVEYELVDMDGGVNCVLAIDANTNELEGIFIYIFSSYTEGYRDIWGSMYSVRPGNNAWLGIELMKQVQIISGCRQYIGCGSNPNTSLKLARVGLRRHTDKLVHYYALSQRPNTDFKIARIVNRKKEADYKLVPDNISIHRVSNVEEIRSFLDEGDKKVVPYKDSAYIEKRYFRHPIHKYESYVIKKDQTILAIFVIRRQHYEDRIAIRMIDFVGDRSAFAYTREFWRSELVNQAIEYVDFYVKGFEEEYMLDAGFVSLEDGDENIIPNYFSPYECSNVDIWCHSQEENVLICKGDGDQDRPC